MRRDSRRVAEDSGATGARRTRLELEGSVTTPERRSGQVADGFELFTDRSVVAMRVNGELKDLATTVTSTDTVEPVTIDSPDGLNILRHSTAHVLAQAVQAVNPEAKLGIGPPVTDGFYYDFDVEEPFSTEDFKALEKAMERIIRQGQR